MIEDFLDRSTYWPREIIENYRIGVVFYEWLIIKNKMQIIEYGRTIQGRIIKGSN
jgi:hypothetical protein